jgi:hypothetical protein
MVEPNLHCTTQVLGLGQGNYGFRPVNTCFVVLCCWLDDIGKEYPKKKELRLNLGPPCN